MDMDTDHKYAAVDEAAALDALDTFSERWDKKYPKPELFTDIRNCV